MRILPNKETKVVYIPAIKIRPYKTRPRRSFDEQQLISLSQSIAKYGLLQPLTVRRAKNGEFELIAGERRLRASVMAGYKKIPCIVIKCSDKDCAVLALTENLQRTYLGFFEEAKCISRLIKKFGFSQDEAARELGVSLTYAADKLRLLRLSLEEQDWITQAGLTECHARALLKISNEDLRKSALSYIIAEESGIKESEHYITELTQTGKHGQKRNKEPKLVVTDVRIFVNTISRAVDTMRACGIDAESHRQETADYIEYTVKIPKSKVRIVDKAI